MHAGIVRGNDGRGRMTAPMNVLIVDNDDSFTFNLSQLVASVTGREPLVVKNTEQRWREMVADRSVKAIVISPGPGSPERATDFGIGREVILETELPLLGVCLGHQGLGAAHGARVIRAPTPMHGRLSRVVHDSSALFRGVPQRFDAVRYHSLSLDEQSIPACLAVTARTADGLVMALQHLKRPHFGVQFHPESVSAKFGERIIRNFLGFAGRAGRRRVAAGQTRPASPGPRAVAVRARRVVSKVLDRWIDPQEVFERLFARAEHCFWLDSATVVPGLSGFSLMGSVSEADGAVLRYRTVGRVLETLEAGRTKRENVGSLVSALRKRLDEPVEPDPSLPLDFQTGLVGFLGYELRNEFGSPTRRTADTPDAAWLDVGRCLVFDHAERRVFLVARESERAGAWLERLQRELSKPAAGARQPRGASGPVVAELSDGPLRYRGKIEQCQQELAAGESYEICLSSEFSVGCKVNPYETYRALRAINPAPYAAFVRFGSLALLSSSPERFLRVRPDGTVCAQPIKGTCARDANPSADARLANWLRSDEKSRAENLMIVDLLRNDIGRVAATGSVHVPKLMEVESYATVHQLVSTVEGTLRADRDGLDCLASAFPGGSMTGAPKLRTMSIIDRLEERPRGPYSGAIGYLSRGGSMDLSIAIRTIVMNASKVTVGSGGGIVALSDPHEEFEEMLLKARAPLQALAKAAVGDRNDWELRFRTE